MTTSIPAVVRNKAVALGAEQWLANLDDLIACICDDWDLTLGKTFEEGTEAFVAEAFCADGSQAVLKLLIPRYGDEAVNERLVLQLADGQGCATLLRYDAERSALLLERLGPSLYDLGLRYDDRLRILADTARQLWRPAPGCGLPTGAAKAAWLIDNITTLWDDLGGPCSRRSVDHAIECAERRIAAHDDERAVLVHGDVHQWNVLQAGDGYKLIDPDGLLAEAEYDLGVIMREDPEELMQTDPRQRSRWLAQRCALNETAIWEWGIVERVSTGLLATSIDLQPVGRHMLEVADRLVDSP